MINRVGSVSYTIKIGLDIHNVIGRKINNQGYVLLKIPTHPYSMSNGYIFEHRVVFEIIIGKYLGNDVVIHHLNEVKNDNRFGNLSLMERGEHTRKHHLGSKRSQEARNNNSIAQIKLNKTGTKHHGYKNVDKEVENLYEKGVPVAQIAELTNITRRTVYNKIEYLGLKENEKV